MYNKIIKENKSFIDNTWQKLENKLSLTSIKSRHKIPYTTVNGVHNDYSDYVFAWTNGFWGGLMWLMYEETKKECYKLTAEESEQKLDKAFEYLEGLHHDVGFMWHITSGANYRLTGNKKSKNRNILAAMSLMSRYNVDGEFIRAWNSPKGGVDKSGWTIIDCMMNINILY